MRTLSDEPSFCFLLADYVDVETCVTMGVAKWLYVRPVVSGTHCTGVSWLFGLCCTIGVDVCSAYLFAIRRSVQDLHRRGSVYEGYSDQLQHFVGYREAQVATQQQISREALRKSLSSCS